MCSDKWNEHMAKQAQLHYDSQSNLGAQLCKQVHSQTAITCSKLTIEKLEQGVKYAQSQL